MLQKRNAGGNGYRQITGEAEARMLHKKRDARRKRCSKVTCVEKTEMVQNNRAAGRNKQ
jgi:hypothetical protein